VHHVGVEAEGVAVARRQSSLAKPMSESTVRGTCTFICFVMKAIAVLHWAAVAVQAVGQQVAGRIRKRGVDDTVERRKVPLHQFKVAEEEQLVLHDGPRASPRPGAATPAG